MSEGNSDARLEGRVIRFIHAGTDELPLRDIPEKNKTEPYLEYGYKEGLNDNGRIIGAENYCAECYQDAVQKVVDQDEDYLFLATYPKQSGSEANENQIVGYIENEGNEWIAEDHVAVFGETKLVSVTDGIPMSELGYAPSKGPLGRWGRTLDEDQAEAVLNHLTGQADVTRECLEKVLDLEEISEYSNSTNNC
jgi:hypothetical protein